jgi:hypothetical protein
MSRHSAAWLAWPLWALTVLTIGVTLSLTSLNEPTSFFWNMALISALVLAFSMVGALVASRHPENPIGWLSLWCPHLDLRRVRTGIQRVRFDHCPRHSSRRRVDSLVRRGGAWDGLVPHRHVLASAVSRRPAVLLTLASCPMGGRGLHRLIHDRSLALSGIRRFPAFIRPQPAGVGSSGA